MTSGNKVNCIVSHSKFKSLLYIALKVKDGIISTPLHEHIMKLSNECEVSARFY